MAQAPDIQAILAALAAQGGLPQAQPSQPGQVPIPQLGAYNLPAQPLAGYPGLPLPTSAGTFDLSAIRPVTTGSLNLSDGVKSPNFGDKGYGGNQSDSRSGGRRRSRSRSPPRRDAYNSYDDRRDDRRGGYRDRSRSPVRGGHFSPQPQRGGRDRSPRRDDDSSEIINIDSNLVGLVIGRSGENLRRVEQETTARIQFITPPDHAGPSRQCRISGSARARSEAKREIFRIIDENNMQGAGQGRGNANKPPKNAPPPRDAPVGEDSMKIMVPDRTVGLIIGRGGETIRDLQDRSGCHINIVAANKSVNGLRPVNLIGSPHAANKAKDLIMEIVESDTRGPQQNEPAPHQYQPPAMHEPSKINETIRVPSDAVGMIIGKGGETIRDMQNSTGCKINVSQASGADIEREIGLVGSRQAIEAAKRAIQDKVDTVREKSGARSGRQDNSGQGQYGQQSGYQGYGQYGQPAQSSQPGQVSSADPTAADPYAMYGGYQNYMAMWYAALANGARNPGDAAPSGS